MLEAKPPENPQSGLEFDIRAFELEIEKEIDNLFIPLGNEAETKTQAEPPAVGDGPTRSAIAEIPRVTVPVSAPASTPNQPEELILTFDQPPQTEPAVVEPVAQAEVLTPNEPEELMLVLESPGEPPDELQTLFESFQASYLSFDWDFSSPNVSALTEVLARLEPYCLKTPETESLYKIMKAVLQRVSARPDSISPQLTEVMREAQGLLKRFLLPEREGVSPGDRSDLKALIARVQAIRNSQIQKDARPPESIAAGQAPPAAGAGHLEVPASAAAVSSLEGSPEDLGDWIGQAQQQLNGALQGLQDVNRRLFQLEEILVSKPALAPLTNRIKSVRSDLEQQIASFRTQESSWSQVAALIRSQRIQRQDDASVSRSGLMTEKSVTADEPAGSAAAGIGTPPAPKRTQREQVCLVTLAGCKYAVLSENVVKVQPINAKKMKNISNRGYGLLKDFKPLFKSIKAGLFGTWLGLSTKVLQSFQFIPLELKGLDVEKPSSDQVKGALLVSNGRQHGIIWSESGNVDLMTETIELAAEPSAIFGRIHRNQGEEIPVLNVDHLLETLHS